MDNPSLEPLPHLLCVLDFDNRFKQVNAAWQNNLGIASDNLLTTTITRWLHPDDIVSTQHALSELSSGNETWIMFETRWRRDTNMDYQKLLWVATVSLTTQTIHAVGLIVSPPKVSTPMTKTTDFIVCY